MGGTAVHRVIYGVLLGWVRLHSGSVWPAVLSHGALNASAGLPMLLGPAAEPPNLAVAGAIGPVGWALLAALVLRRSPIHASSRPVEAAEPA